MFSSCIEKIHKTMLMNSKVITATSTSTITYE